MILFVYRKMILTGATTSNLASHLTLLCSRYHIYSVIKSQVAHGLIKWHMDWSSEEWMWRVFNDWSNLKWRVLIDRWGTSSLAKAWKLLESVGFCPLPTLNQNKSLTLTIVRLIIKCSNHRLFWAPPLTKLIGVTPLQEPLMSDLWELYELHDSH